MWIRHHHSTQKSIRTICFLLLVGVFSVQASYRVVWGQSQTEILDIAWSPTGNWIARAFYGGTIDVIDAISGQTAFTFNNGESPATAVTWNPMNNSQLAGSIGHDIFIWNISTGQTLFTMQDSATQQIISTDLWSNAPDAIVWLDWSNDGTKLASMSRSSLLQVWNPSTGSLLRNVTGIGQSVAVSWSSDSNQIAVTDGFTIRIANSGAGTITTLPNGPHGNFLTAIDWGPNNTRIAVSTVAGEVIIWGTSGGQLLQYLNLTSAMVYDVAWSPNGNSLASTSFDGAIRVWNTSTWSLSGTIQTNNSSFAPAMAWSPDSTKITYADSDGGLQIIPAPSTITCPASPTAVPSPTP
jgi:WD40 repeat protein